MKMMKRTESARGASPAPSPASVGHDQQQLVTTSADEPELAEAGHESPPRYSLTIAEAREMFRAAGVPRSRRTLNRFCERDELDCVLADSQVGGKYLIDRRSVEIKITELRQQVPVRSEDDAPTASPGVEATLDESPATRVEALEQELDQLRTKAVEQREVIVAREKRIDEQSKRIFDLEVTNRAKEIVIERFTDERVKFIEEIKDAQHRLGQLETRLALSSGDTRDLGVRAEARGSASGVRPVDGAAGDSAAAIRDDENLSRPAS